MAIVINPLHSVAASGRFSGVCFTKKKSGRTIACKPRSGRTQYSDAYKHSQAHFSYLSQVFSRFGSGDFKITVLPFYNAESLLLLRQIKASKWQFVTEYQKGASKPYPRSFGLTTPYANLYTGFPPGSILRHSVKLTASLRGTTTFRGLFHRLWCGRQFVRWKISVYTYLSLTQSQRDSITLTESAKEVFQPYFYDPILDFQTTPEFIAFHVCAQWMLIFSIGFNPKQYLDGMTLDYTPETPDIPPDKGLQKSINFFNVPVANIHRVA